MTISAARSMPIFTLALLFAAQLDVIESKRMVQQTSEDGKLQVQIDEEGSDEGSPTGGSQNSEWAMMQKNHPGGTQYAESGMMQKSIPPAGRGEEESPPGDTRSSPGNEESPGGDSRINSLNQAAEEFNSAMNTSISFQFCKSLCFLEMFPDGWMDDLEIGTQKVGTFFYAQRDFHPDRIPYGDENICWLTGKYVPLQYEMSDIERFARFLYFEGADFTNRVRNKGDPTKIDSRSGADGLQYSIVSVNIETEISRTRKMFDKVVPCPDPKPAAMGVPAEKVPDCLKATGCETIPACRQPSLLMAGIGKKVGCEQAINEFEHTWKRSTEKLAEACQGGLADRGGKFKVVAISSNWGGVDKRDQCLVEWYKWSLEMDTEMRVTHLQTSLAVAEKAKNKAEVKRLKAEIKKKEKEHTAKVKEVQKAAQDEMKKEQAELKKRKADSANLKKKIQKLQKCLKTGKSVLECTGIPAEMLDGKHLLASNILG